MCDSANPAFPAAPPQAQRQPSNVGDDQGGGTSFARSVGVSCSVRVLTPRRALCEYRFQLIGWIDRLIVSAERECTRIERSARAPSAFLSGSVCLPLLSVSFLCFKPVWCCC